MSKMYNPKISLIDERTEDLVFNDLNPDEKHAVPDDYMS
jgi:hypothetical protein